MKSTRDSPCPEGQGLLVPDAVELAGDDQPLPGRRASRPGPRPGRTRRRPGGGPVGSRCQGPRRSRGAAGTPRTPAARCRSGRAGSAPGRAPVQPGADRAAAGRVGGHPVGVVLDRAAGGPRSSRRLRPGDQPVGPPAQSPARSRATNAQRPPVEHGRHRRTGVVEQRPSRRPARSTRTRSVRGQASALRTVTATPAPEVSTCDDEVPGARRRARRRRQVVGLPPAGQQVEVDLVGLGAGDRVVVGAVDAAAARPCRAPRRDSAGAVQRGEGGQPLRVGDRGPRRPAGPAWCRCRRRPCRCRPGSCPGSAGSAPGRSAASAARTAAKKSRGTAQTNRGQTYRAFQYRWISVTHLFGGE